MDLVAENPSKKDSKMEIKTYHLPPTVLVPNSPRPLLHYKAAFPGSDCRAVSIHDKLSNNGWQVQWIYRYGRTQRSHYHSSAHECMAVLSGSATIRFGVADTTPDLEASTRSSSGREDGGIELQARAGDVFVVPAGTAHKTFDALPESSFELLTPGDGHGVAADDFRGALAGIKLSGFTMMGAYFPKNEVWDFATGGEHVGACGSIWAVPKPDADPVLGNEPRGLRALWT